MEQEINQNPIQYPNQNSHQSPPQFETTKTEATKKHGFLITLAILMLLSGGYATWYFINSPPKYEDYSVIKHDPTADWKIYRNEEYGFEFKYSTKKYIAEELSKFSQVLNEKILVSLYDQVDKVEVEKLGGGEYSRFQVYVSDNKDKLSLIDFANINYKSHLYNLVKTKVSGYDAIIFGEMTNYVLVAKDNSIFIIRPIDEILSTFKFIEEN